MQDTLFGNLDPREEIELKMPEKQEAKKLENLFSRRTVHELMKEAEPYRKLCRKYLFYFVEGNRKVIPAVVELMMGNKQKLKADWVNLLVLMKCDANRWILATTMPDDLKPLMRRIFEKHFLPVKEAEQLCDKKVITRDSWSYLYCEINPELKPWVTTTSGYIVEKKKFSESRKHIAYLVPASSNSLYDLLPHVFPETQDIKPLDTLPDSASNLKTYNAEAEIFAALPILNSLTDADKIQMGDKRMPAAMIKKAATAIAYPEFFVNTVVRPGNLAATLLVNAFGTYRRDYYKADEPEKELLTIITAMSDTDGYSTYILLPHIVGMRAKDVDYCKADQMMKNIIDTLKKYHNRGWMDFNVFYLLCRGLTNDAEWNNLIFGYNFEYMSLRSNITDLTICYDTLISDISRPFVEATLFMFATLGVVEIAYDSNPDLCQHSYYDGLRYIRLTALGKYLFDITDKYERKAQDNRQFFEIDDESLIVRSLVDNNPYIHIVNSLATQISPKMFKVTAESFLNECEKKSDIESNISLFRQYICAKPSEAWETFFKQLLAKCSPLKAPAKKYSMLQIPPEDKELQRIFATEPELRKYILKAEKYIILIEPGCKPKVQGILKRYGYII
ncbi:MAG: hypothetical protein ACI4T5_09970 [Prevotella sp.]